MNGKRKKSHVVIGILLVVVGLILLLNNLGLMPVALPHYILSWKTLLVALGTIFTITEKDKTAGIVLIAVGFYFLIPDIWGVSPHEAGLFWPILFLVIGLSVLLSKR
jgi:CDP-diglyceride synthetase